MNFPDTPLRLLVIEDNDDHAALLEHFLRATPFSIEVLDRAADGETGIRAALKGTYDCVFLDFELPDLSGTRILQEVLTQLPSLLVIMVTARGSEELAVEAMKLGAVDYLVKGTLTGRSLERAILGLLERKRLQEKIHQQSEKLLIAERQRAMLASVGAACHHFSQPITSLMGRLELLLLKETDLTDRQKSLLDDCFQLTRRLQELLAQFRRIEDFRTTPYLDEVEILDIEANPAPTGSVREETGV